MLQRSFLWLSWSGATAVVVATKRFHSFVLFFQLGDIFFGALESYNKFFTLIFGGDFEFFQKIFHLSVVEHIFVLIIKSILGHSYYIYIFKYVNTLSFLFSFAATIFIGKSMAAMLDEFFIEAIEGLLSLFFWHDQFCFWKDFQMMGDCWLRKANLFGDFCNVGTFFFLDHIQNCVPVAVARCLEEF